MKTLKIMFYAAFIAVIIASCNREEVVEPTGTDAIGEESVLNPGYLQFANWDEFDAKLKELNSMKKEAFLAFEIEKSFSSFYSNYESFKEEEEQIMNSTGFSLSAEKHKLLMDELANKYSSVQISEFEGGGIYLKVNLFDEIFSRIINKEGYVAVGNYLFKFNDKEHKVVKDLEHPQLKIADVPDVPEDPDEPTYGGSGFVYPTKYFWKVADTDVLYDHSDIWPDADMFKVEYQMTYYNNFLAFTAQFYVSWNWGVTWSRKTFKTKNWVSYTTSDGATVEKNDFYLADDLLKYHEFPGKKQIVGANWTFVASPISGSGTGNNMLGGFHCVLSHGN